MQETDDGKTRVGGVHAMHGDAVDRAWVGLPVVHADHRYRVTAPDEFAGKDALLHLGPPDYGKRMVSRQDRIPGGRDEAEARPAHGRRPPQARIQSACHIRHATSSHTVSTGELLTLQNVGSKR